MTEGVPADPPLTIAESRPDDLTVTRPLVPELEAVLPYLQDILARRWLTNDGRYARLLERRLAGYLGVSATSVVTNATLGLDIAVKAALPEGGEVITTPYSFPATYHVLLTNPLVRTVFADIDAAYGLDPDAVEAAITPRTRGILAVHTYGYPCAVDRLAAIAARHDLRLIYDAAHTFGVRLDGAGIGTFGDLSVFSFHATKVFTTLEGGCITPGVGQDPQGGAMRRVRLLRNFGITGEEEVEAYGLNAKMDEVRAAFGLSSLALVEGALERRRQVVERYLAYFDRKAAPEFGLCCDVYRRPDLRLNYAYFPVLVHPTPTPTPGLDRDVLHAELRRHGIWARKYFFPTVTTSPIYDGLYDPAQLQRATYASRNVLCLPVHHEMTDSDSDRVIAVIDGLLDATRTPGTHGAARSRVPAVPSPAAR